MARHLPSENDIKVVVVVFVFGGGVAAVGGAWEKTGVFGGAWVVRWCRGYHDLQVGVKR